MTRLFWRRPASAGLGAIKRDERGTALLEFALVLPFFVFTIVSMIDVGMALFIRAQVQTAAQAGVNYAAIDGFNADGITAAATNATSTAVTVGTPTSFYACDTAGTLTTVSSGTTCSSGLTAAQYASVTVSAQYTPIMTTVWSSLTGSSTATLSFTVIGPTS